MEDEEQVTGSRAASHRAEADQRSEPVRSRWTPKPEQIIILESIFNSGMVNPPKDETVRIRKLLEEFGSVGDANVFYWFQNRRSRSRRRQRQIQAAAGEQPQVQYDQNTLTGGFLPNDHPLSYGPINTRVRSGSASSSFGPGGNIDATNIFSFPGHSTAGLQELEQNSYFGPPDTSNLHYQSGVITVFINGVATEVGRGPFDMKAMFGGDFVLFNSSGVAVEVDKHGFLVQSLQQGENYFLVPRQS